MGLKDMLSTGRKLAQTGKSVLRKIGEGAHTANSLGGKVDKATGGATGAAFEAAKSLPGIGALATNAERALNMADSYSKKGIKASERGGRLASMGEKAAGGDLSAIGGLVGGKNLAGNLAGTAVSGR